MALSSSQPHVTAALLDDEQDVLRCATCPMCHTQASLTRSALEAGGDWRCVRCGQTWDAARLAAVTAYAAWIVDRDGVGRRRGSESSQDTALFRDLPTEQAGGNT
jgi:ribosomal protein L37AE/L43A